MQSQRHLFCHLANDESQALLHLAAALISIESPHPWPRTGPGQALDGKPKFNYRTNPPPADGRKVILTDTDHLWGVGGDVAWVWKSFLRGLNPLFMDPYEQKVRQRGNCRSSGFIRSKGKSLLPKL